jgi:hypothetical protein
MHPTDNYSARKLKNSKLEATRSSAHRLPLLKMHKMHPTDNYSARNSKQLEARMPVGWAQRTDCRCLWCIQCILPITIQLVTQSSSKARSSAHRLPLLKMHKMHPTDNYSARSQNARRVRSAHRLPLLVMHKMHPTDNYSARSSNAPRVGSAHRLPLLVMHKMHPTDNYSARNS